MVAIYARQSVDKKDSISIETQIEKCKSEVQENEQIKLYIDKGYSGKNTDRPNYKKMINDIEQGLISKIIVYKLDRISRAIIDFSVMLNMFEKFNVKFVSCNEKFDTSTPMGRAMVNIVMVFAQLERETIQQRIKDNYYERGKKGYYLGGVAPFGYTKISVNYNGKKTYSFKENDEQIDDLKNIFEEYASTDISLGKLAEKLTKKSSLTNRQNAWSGVSLGRLLRNPIYVKADADVYVYLKSKNANMNNDITEFIGENGCYVYAERRSITKSKFTDLTDSYVTIALHKGVIDSNIWLECQHKLDLNNQVKNSGKGSHTWLSGLIKCGYCGYAINVVNNNRGNSYINCGGRKLKICNERKKVIHPEDIESIVEKQLLQHMKELKTGINFRQNLITDNIEANKLKIELVQIDNQINKLMDSLAQGNSITIEYINKKISELDEHRKKLLGKIEEAQKNNSLQRKFKKVDLDDCIENWASFDLVQKKSIAKIFIDRISVTDDEIEVTFY